MIKVIIVDDEPIARRSLLALLERDPDVEVVAECGSGSEAVKLIRKSPPDLLYLDIQMPDMDGFTVLTKINRSSISAIIFVTAYDQYAIRAFDAHALDYLLKPYTDDRFTLALERAKTQIRQRGAIDLSRKLRALLNEQTAESEYATRFLIKESSRVFFVKVEEIDWIEAADYYANLHVGPRSHLLRETMSDLETRLDPNMFLRVHRSAIANLRRVKEIQTRPGPEYSVILKDGTSLKLSRGRREQLETLLQRLS